MLLRAMAVVFARHIGVCLPEDPAVLGVADLYHVIGNIGEDRRLDFPGISAGTLIKKRPMRVPEDSRLRSD